MTDTYSAIRATMLNDVNRLNIISQNLANATTAGYKKQIAVNKSFLEFMNFEGVDKSGEKNTEYARYGLPFVEAVNDPSMGTVKFTGNSLDLVATGNTYFTVLTPEGIAYTKQGSFNKNSSGIIVNPLGYPVLGEGGEIFVNNDDPVIDEQGNVFIDGKQIDTLQTVTFKPNAPLSPTGFGMYINRGEAIEIADVVNNKVLIKQGYLEMSNVATMEEMVKMIEVMRHFETAQKYMMAYDEMLDNAINVVGEV